MPAYTIGKFIEYHAQLVGDRGRVESYRQAIRAVVTPGDVVLDIGTGTGILAFLACQAGAKRVYAVDQDHRAIELARQICAANGLQDRVVFLDGASYDVELPEPADVVIAGNIHNLGLEVGMLSSVADSQKRLLRKNARVIPASIELIAVPVEGPGFYKRFDMWNDDSAGIDFSPTRKYAINSCYTVPLDGGCFLGEPGVFAHIDFGEAGSVYVSGKASCVATRTGVLHGIGGWFRAKLSADVTMSNDPSILSARWTQVFLPVEHPVLLQAGDVVSTTISTNDGGDWRWEVEVYTGGQVPGGSPERKVRFDHTTFVGVPLLQKQLQATISPTGQEAAPGEENPAADRSRISFSN
jgi:SAM-dependent methyltransferase